MAMIEVLKHLHLETLTDEQRTALTKRLKKYRRELQAALTAVEAGLEELTQEPPQGPRGQRRPPTTRRPKR